MRHLLVACLLAALPIAATARAGDGGEEPRSAKEAAPAKAAGREAPASSAGEDAPDRLGRVKAFMRDFNLHDPDAMVKHLAADVQWLNIEGSTISVQAAGIEEVRKAMADYFEAVPVARAVMEESMVSGRYVIFRERAFWEASGAQTQSSLAVYEMKDGLIHRVWYFPSEK